MCCYWLFISSLVCCKVIYFILNVSAKLDYWKVKLRAVVEVNLVSHYNFIYTDLYSATANLHKFYNLNESLSLLEWYLIINDKYSDAA